MHEFGLAQSVINELTKLAKDGKWKKVYEVSIEFQDDHIDAESFASLLRMTGKGTIFEKTDFKVKKTGDGETEYTIKDAFVD